jgi:hypothetical protein
LTPKLTVAGADGFGNESLRGESDIATLSETVHASVGFREMKRCARGKMLHFKTTLFY